MRARPHPYQWADTAAAAAATSLCSSQVLQKDMPFKSPVSNFYMTDSVSRASAVMAKCVLAKQQSKH